MNVGKTMERKRIMKTERLKCLYVWMACTFCVLSVASCVNDGYEDGKMESENVTVNLNFKAGDIKVETDGTVAENRLNSIRVYVFNGDGEDARLLGYHHEKAIPGNSVEYSFPIELGLKQSQTGQKCRFYIVANEDEAGGLHLPDDDTGPFSFPEATRDEVDGAWSFKDGEDITPAELKSLRFNGLPSYGEPIPMAVEGSRTITSQNQQCEFILKRSVAKLCMYFAKTGGGELYMDRGMYLYNVPEEGYLFPQKTLTDNNIGAIGHTETDLDTEEKPDSEHQRGGKELLVPNYLDGTTTPAHKNEITKGYPLKGEPSGPDPDNYQMLPAEPVYMFAHYTGVENPTGAGIAGTDRGYYVKLLFHMHESNDAEDGDGEYENHDGKIHRVFLPKIEANDEVRLFSHIYMKGYIELQLHWMVAGWQTGGGDIVFN